MKNVKLIAVLLTLTLTFAGTVQAGTGSKTKPPVAEEQEKSWYEQIWDLVTVND
ncbi:hypothetical protein LJ739_10610 [Aestuariibacter halophilus]|uniref:Uncharacterized protein n=1 Tax=Fluctibacter halophilus TaxID=226011 RepID=A0ABS8G7Z0_9ALTE|nr:hypothetical protein [Aestuariibacter halophilus]MCC2616692.1 hypothetical protein [Aestuariibacter halophilus]